MRAPKVLVIVGPTASGKSQLALSLASSFAGEIVSLDSALIYRGMDIGTAKPTAAEQAAVPHHLIDLIDPPATYSVGQYLKDYARVVAAIHARGKLPIVVGGTMMYHHALTKGLSHLPESTPATRLKTQNLREKIGLAGLYHLLQKIDPKTAMRLKPQDGQRIERALEVFYLSGKPISSFYAVKEPGLLPPEDTFTLTLIPEHRLWLHKRIEQRFSGMIAAGFIDEVKHLKERYPQLTLKSPSMRAVGYRQIFQYLNNQISYDDMMKQSIYATRQLAKRQLTWLRRLNPELNLSTYPDEKSDYKKAIEIWYHRDKTF